LRYCVAMKTKYKHLNCEERTLIQLSLEKGSTIRAIALSLDPRVRKYSVRTPLLVSRASGFGQQQSAS